MQTPQAFAFSMIYDAYQKLLHREEQGEALSITDDAMVVETVLGEKVRLVEGSYENLKITTPEDLKIAELFLRE